jgi:hypothetical protein
LIIYWLFYSEKEVGLKTIKKLNSKVEGQWTKRQIENEEKDRKKMNRKKLMIRKTESKLIEIQSVQKENE